MLEPVLRADDLRLWDVWCARCRLHAQGTTHRRRVERAKTIVTKALATANSWAVLMSGGKDSTALALLVAEVRAGLPWVSQKDDLDFPGEESYVTDLAMRLGSPVEILRPAVSPRSVVARDAATVGVTGDWHGRSAALAKECFYGLVESHCARYAGAFLGLRSEESRSRRLNRATHGALYRKRPSSYHPDGQWVATPLADWSAEDVYGYVHARGVELLPLYRCVALLHARDPGRIRKSWWLPHGDGARHGQVAWLKRYYPSLFRQLCEWMPDAALFA